MLALRSKFRSVLTALAVVVLLQACGDSQESEQQKAEQSTSQTLTSEAISGNASSAEADSVASEAEEASQQTSGSGYADSQALSVNGSEGEQAVEDPDEVQEIDPDTLEAAGQVELKQYSVAWVGSGTIGGGTLTMDGQSYPFKIVGLGVGGFGASSVTATGVVYNLPVREEFAGTYGNARLGLTAGDSGSGKLWLRNSDGVVIELESEMRGLALAGGVDGLVIQWDEDEKSSVDNAMEDTEDAIGKGIEAGADAVETGIGKVKGWFNDEDDGE
ncbi:MAG: hypothetical protein ABJ013_08095 [Halioglobus sp.]